MLAWRWIFWPDVSFACSMTSLLTQTAELSARVVFCHSIMDSYVRETALTGRVAVLQVKPWFGVKIKLF